MAAPLRSLTPDMLAYFRAHDLAGHRIREVGELAFGHGWEDALRKALGLKSTTQLSGWVYSNRCPPDYQDRLIAAIKQVRDAEFAAAQAAAAARYAELTDLIVEMATNRLPEPRCPEDPPKTV